MHGRQLSAEREVSDVLGGMTALHLEAANKLRSNAVPRQLRGQVCLATPRAMHIKQSCMPNSQYICCLPC